VLPGLSRREPTTKERQRCRMTFTLNLLAAAVAGCVFFAALVWVVLEHAARRRGAA